MKSQGCRIFSRKKNHRPQGTRAGSLLKPRLVKRSLVNPILVRPLSQRARIQDGSSTPWTRGTRATSKRRSLMTLRQLLAPSHGRRGNSKIRRQGTNYFALPKKEVMYPIHVAVEANDVQMLRVLLARGADVQQETDRGRNAFDVAYDSDSSGSHREVTALLKGRKARSVRQFMQRNVT
mmetsp:Transcript_72236/g.159503  ORF Transcript_72236/g.159503 Transcript_72236/m.159503 type:complete len:179 (-) Transcript_72236:84-620(-)